jgi:hypothetical protein
MDMLRTDANSNPLHSRPTPLAKHSPFMCCSQVAASYGFCVAAAALKEELENNNPIQLEALRRGWSEQGTLALWKHRAVVSNLSAAHFNLDAVCRLWPIASQMASEVKSCTQYVSQTGPVGLI